MNRIMITLACVLTLCAFTPLASADWMNFNGVALNETVTIHAAGTLADNLTVYAGQEKVNFRGVDYLVYCVDTNHYAASADMTVKPVTSVNNGDKVAFLFNTYAPGVTTNLQAAALGVALWEVINETSPTFNANSGYFSITGNTDVATAANVLLASMPTHYDTTNYPSILFNPTAQSFVVGISNTPVPEPATMAMVVIGGAGMLLRRSRRKA